MWDDWLWSIDAVHMCSSRSFREKKTWEPPISVSWRLWDSRGILLHSIRYLVVSFFVMLMWFDEYILYMYIMYRNWPSSNIELTSNNMNVAKREVFPLPRPVFDVLALKRGKRMGQGQLCAHVHDCLQMGDSSMIVVSPCGNWRKWEWNDATWRIFTEINLYI